MSDIDTAVVDSLKALDPERPIREADISRASWFRRSSKAWTSFTWTGDEAKMTARTPSVKTSTANYWLDLPVPVFLLVADFKAKKVHYVSVKEHIRAEYSKSSIRGHNHLSPT